LTQIALSPAREIAAVVGVNQATVHNDLTASDDKSSLTRRKDSSQQQKPSGDDEVSSPPAIRFEETPPYDPPILSVAGLETGEIIGESEPIDITEAAHCLADNAGKARMDRLHFVAALSRLSRTGIPPAVRGLGVAKARLLSNR